MKVKYKDKLKEYKKSTISNILVIAGLYAIDLISLMLDINATFRNNAETEVTRLMLNWSLVMYLILFALLLLTFINVNKNNFKIVRRLMIVMMIMTIFNFATFVYAGYVFSLLLIAPILMLLYMQQKAKDFIH